MKSQEDSQKNSETGIVSRGGIRVKPPQQFAEKARRNKKSGSAGLPVPLSTVHLVINNEGFLFLRFF